jgi:hypothetical protein
LLWIDDGALFWILSLDPDGKVVEEYIRLTNLVINQNYMAAQVFTEVS